MKKVLEFAIGYSDEFVDLREINLNGLYWRSHRGLGVLANSKQEFVIQQNEGMLTVFLRDRTS